MMRALVFGGAGKKTWEMRPVPRLLKSTDAVVRMEKTTICGTDLHILHGNVATCEPGRILGHEGIGVIEEVGKDVKRFKAGDRIIISCITSCGRCPNCAKGFFGHCLDGGWLLGNTVDGTQAEAVRVPHVDFSCHAVPPSLSRGPPSAELDPYVMLSDILPTGLEVGVDDGHVAPGKTVAIVGAGPVGLAALVAATARSPSMLVAVDTNAHRLQQAKKLGATHTVDNSDGKAADELMRLTGGKGIDVAIEAIGLPVGWQVCEDSVAAGGNIAILGVHGKSVTLHLERMWRRNFTLTAGLVHTNTIPKLLDQTAKGEILPENLITHRFKLSEILTAYDTFGNAGRHNALKVIMNNDLSKPTLKKA